MDQMYALLKAVSIFFLLVLFMQILKPQDIFNDSHQPIFNRLVTDLVLPVTIVSTMAGSSVRPDEMVAAMVMLASIVCCGYLAYRACRMMALSRSMTGSLVLLAGIGCTSTLAYPLIRQIFGGVSEAMTIGLIIGEFGVIIPTFTLGVLTASWFGQRKEGEAGGLCEIVSAFTISPIFIALVLGLAVSQIPPVSTLFTSTFFPTLFGYFADGLEILVAISLGLLLKPVQLRPILPLFLLIFCLKLLLQPVFVLAGAWALSLPPFTMEVHVGEAAMPSGAIAAVLADRYGCDGSLASALVIATSVFSLLTIPLVSYLLL